MTLKIEGNIPHLSQTVEVVPGNIPVVLTVPHDGGITYLNNAPLFYDLQSKKRDLNTAEIARSVYKLLETRVGRVPTLLIQQIKRQCITPEIGNYFVQATTLSLQAMLKRHEAVLLLDLHGFNDREEGSPQEDVVLGTRHATTISKDDEAFGLAMRLDADKIKVYLPGSKPREGERFAATGEGTLLTALSRKGFFPDVRGIQLEVAGRYRNGDYALRNKLVTSLADYIVWWWDGQEPGWPGTSHK